MLAVDELALRVARNYSATALKLLVEAPMDRQVGLCGLE
jgi:hypothetical protein